MADDEARESGKEQPEAREACGMDTRLPTPPHGRQRTRPGLVWVASVFLVLALAAVGILAWRSVTLSDALAKATATTTTTMNRWGEWGTSSAYLFYSGQFAAIQSKRDALVAQTNALQEDKASHSKYAFRATGNQELINMIQALPDAPEDVRAAQREYLGILVDEQYAFASLAKWGDSAWSELNEIFPKEYRLYLAWIDAFGHSR
jgi:hypothetical protein